MQLIINLKKIIYTNSSVAIRILISESHMVFLEFKKMTI